MVSAILYSLLTGLIWAAVGAIFGKAPDDRKKLITFFAIYSAIYFFVSLTRLPFVKPEPLLLLKLAMIMIPASLGDLLGFWLLKKAMSSGSQSVAWAVVQSSMILPFIGGLFLPGVRAGVFAFIGLFLLLFGLCLLSRDKKAGTQNGSTKYYWTILMIAFLLVGSGQFMRLLPNYIHLSETVLAWRVTISGFVGFLTWNGVAAVRRIYDFKGIWKTAVLYGLVVLSGQFTFFCAADAASVCGWSSAVYPTAVGTCIILFTLYCALFRKEKLSIRTISGILLIVIGIAGLSIK